MTEAYHKPVIDGGVYIARVGGSFVPQCTVFVFFYFKTKTDSQWAPNRARSKSLFILIAYFGYINWFLTRPNKNRIRFNETDFVLILTYNTMEMSTPV